MRTSWRAFELCRAPAMGMPMSIPWSGAARPGIRAAPSGSSRRTRRFRGRRRTATANIWRSADAPMPGTQEAAAFVYALGLYQSVCGLTFTAGGFRRGRRHRLVEDRSGRGRLGATRRPWRTDLGYFDPTTESWAICISGATASTPSCTRSATAWVWRIRTMAARTAGRRFRRRQRFLNRHLRSEPGHLDGHVLQHRLGWGRLQRELWQSGWARGLRHRGPAGPLWSEHATAAGNDVYELPTGRAGWSCIWDAGGPTRSKPPRARPAPIDLRAATLRTGDPNAGGFISSRGFRRRRLHDRQRRADRERTGGGRSDDLIGNAPPIP